MKITIEIPDFEIWGNNDDTPTTFVSEIRNEIKCEVVKQIMAKSDEAVRDANLFCENEIKHFQSLALKEIEIIAAKFEKECNDYVKSLQDKATRC